MQCFGDADVLGMMGFGELYRAKDIVEFLGAEFSNLPEVFSSV
jgi:hypothetical protein